ncbi:MAG: protoporphyrinogen oxidase [Bacteroidales bacterium]|nr:protoporphyrinogen oxidase [Bacteroidales bacterium]
MEQKQKKVAIIGGGITGLVTAFNLKKEQIPFTIFESSNHMGGVIASHRENGFLYETGPNSGTISQPEVMDLFADLKDECKLEIANDASGKRLIWKGGRWHAMPSGIGSGISTPLFSLKDKLRILGEPFRKPGTNPNESLADLVKRRMGQSFLDYAIDPFILGIYAGDPQYIVPKYALPKLYNLEQNYGSFIGGAIKKRKEPKDENQKKATGKIFSVEGGLEELVKALVRKLGKENIKTECKDLSIKPAENGFQIKGQNIDETFTHIVSTVNSAEVEKLFSFIGKETLAPITRLKYARVTEVAVGFKKWNGISLDAFGGLIPFKENRNLLGALFMSTLFKDRAPEGGALITTFVGGMRKAELADLRDDELENLIADEMKIIMGMKDFKPDLLKTKSHSRAIAQYGADSGERIQAIETIEKKYPGLFLAGSMIGGIGMADRIKQGRTVTDRIIQS